MKSMLFKWFIDIPALGAAILLVPGVHMQGDILELIFLLILFGFLNIFLRPVYLLFSFPIVLITAGPLMLIFNALVLWAYAVFAGFLGLGLSVNGFGSALLGAFVISVIRVMASKFARLILRSLRFRRERRWLGKLERYKTRLEEEIAGWPIPDGGDHNSETISMKR